MQQSRSPVTTTRDVNSLLNLLGPDAVRDHVCDVGSPYESSLMATRLDDQSPCFENGRTTGSTLPCCFHILLVVVAQNLLKVGLEWPLPCHPEHLACG